MCGAFIFFCNGVMALPSVSRIPLRVVVGPNPQPRLFCSVYTAPPEKIPRKDSQICFFLRNKNSMRAPANSGDMPESIWVVTDVLSVLLRQGTSVAIFYSDQSEGPKRIQQTAI